MAVDPHDTLAGFVKVQTATDRKVYALLRQATRDVNRQLAGLTSQKIGAVIRRDQLLLARAALLERAKALTVDVGDVVAAAKIDAAIEADRQALAYDAVLMQSVANDPTIAAYLKSSAITSSRTAVELAERRLFGKSYIPLAEQVYRSGVVASGIVDSFVNSALARGLTAREFAKEAESLVNPATPGGLSYASMRLARTEINNAFHARSIDNARAKPWVEAMKWNLSGSHPRPDACNDYADGQHFKGGDPGVYRIDEVPQKPHPHCLCYVTQIDNSEAAWLDSFIAGDYDDYIDQEVALRRRPAGTSAAAAKRAPAPESTTVPGRPEGRPARARAYEPIDPQSLGSSVRADPTEMRAEARDGGAPYSRAFMTADGKFNAEREALHVQIVEDHLRGIVPSGRRPVQYMNGGGPGSGKSSLRVGDNAKITGYPDTREANEATGMFDFRERAAAALIDPDAIKMMLPEVRAARAAGNDPNWAAKAHEESSYLAKRIHAAATDRGLDLVYDGTGDGGLKSVQKKVAVARGKGYRVEANYIYLDPDEGVRRAADRAKRTGRVVPEVEIRRTYQDVSSTFQAVAEDGVFDTIRLFDNNGGGGKPARLIAEGGTGRFDALDPDTYEKFRADGLE